jgi:hypothetical protein
LSFLPVAEIEELARGIVARTARAGEVQLPVAIEWIVETVCDLAIEWRQLPLGEEGVVLAGLDVRRRVLALNELMRFDFERTPGLERFSMAHEVGHWLLHINRAALEHPRLPGFEPAFPFLCRGDRASQREWQAEQFAASLLMPRDLIAEAVAGMDLTRWPARYALRDRFGVSISALTRRLRDLGIGFVHEGRIYRSREETVGQKALFD